MKATADAVGDWAEYQNLAGELDSVETSPIAGRYDWKAYLQEETKLAQQRERPKSKKAAASAPPQAPPSVFYA